MAANPSEYVSPVAEYKQLVGLIREEGAKGGDELYQKLVDKEQNALVAVNRVIDNEQRKRVDELLFYNMPLVNVVALFANTWKNIFLELAVYRDFKDVVGLWHVFTKKDRKVYVGMMIGFIAFFVYMIDIIG